MTLPRPASLPMYDADRGAVRAWWRHVAAAMRAEGLADVPDQPLWPADLPAHWRAANLLLSQTCGCPLVTQLHGRVQVVGAFRYTAPGCSGIGYRSELLVRQSDSARAIANLRGRIAAINDRGSHSGCNALRARVAPLAVDGRFFAAAVETGSHGASLAAVREGRADVASIDCVSLAGLRRAQPQLLHGLRSIGSTAEAPGLPLITSALTSPEDLGRLRRALASAASDPSLDAERAALFIGGYEDAEPSRWQIVREMAHSARGLVCCDP